MEKIFLRPLLEDDVNENYLSWFKDPEVTKFLEVDGNSLTKQLVIDHLEKGKINKSYYIYAICLSENNKHIGNVKLGPINYKHNTSNFVIIIGDKRYWGQGIAAKAVKKTSEIAFNELNIRKITAGMYSENKGSIQALINAGFFIEATLKDQFVLNGEYQDNIIVSCFNPKFVKNE